MAGRRFRRTAGLIPPFCGISSTNLEMIRKPGRQTSGTMDTPTPRRGALLSLPPLACLTWVSVLGGMRASRRKPMATNSFRRTIILPFSVVLGHARIRFLAAHGPSEILDEASEPPPPRTCSHPTRIAIGTCDALWFATGGPSTPTACPQPLRLPPYHGVSFGTPARHLLFFGPPFPRYKGRGLPFLPAEAPAPPPPSRASEAYLGGVSCWRSGAAISPAGVSRRAGITVISVLFSVRGAGGGPFLAASSFFRSFPAVMTRRAMPARILFHPPFQHVTPSVGSREAPDLAISEPHDLPRRDCTTVSVGRFG